MIFLTFKSFVLAALQRSAASLVVDGVDLLTTSVNMARKNIERKRDFELAKAVADLTVPLSEFTSLSGATVAGTATAISIKTVLNASLSTDGVSFVPIGYMSRQAHQQRLGRNYVGFTTLERQLEGQPTATGTITLVRFGDSVYMSPTDADTYDGATSVTVRMDVVKWLDDYADDTDTDFLLEHCVDYMMLETFRYLQLFIHDDARLQVSAETLARAWHAVVAWDSNLVVGDVDDANLD